MKIAVIGAGAIGSLVAAYLTQNNQEVELIGRPEAVAAIRQQGVRVSGVRGDITIPVAAATQVSSQPELVILATKTQDSEAALTANLAQIKDALLLTTQNGIQAEALVAKYLPEGRIISSIIMFGVTYVRPAEVVHNFEGSWIIGRFFNQAPDGVLVQLSSLLSQAFPTVISEDIRGMKYLKIFLNANNCIPALLGVSMQEAFSDLRVSRLGIAIWKEGLGVVSKAGIKLVSLPAFPVENLTKLTSLPGAQAAEIFSGIMTGLSKEPLYGSVLQSIQRNRPSEIDYLNGEFLRLGADYQFAAPLNQRLVELVHQVEQSKSFLTKDTLLGATREWVTDHG